MASSSFQFRECLSPRCGLRYPMLDESELGERCPICLGETALAARTSHEREPVVELSDTAPPAGPEALLDNVRSAWNVGSIFRSAEGFGFRHLYLCGITPTPVNDQVAKTALGAERVLPWSSHRNGVALLGELRNRGHAVWVLEHTERSEHIESVAVPEAHERLVLVVGNEQAGVDPGILDLATRIVHIQMAGWKRSFNVAVAFAVAAHLLRRP